MKTSTVIAFAAALALCACNKPADTAKTEAAAAPAAEKPTGGAMLKADATDAEKIASATSAAPKAIADGAAVMDMAADGTMKELRKGTNGFACMADLPVTPGPDPMCVDANGMQWLHAFLSKKDPPKGLVGFAYMLQGGTDASNTEPFAEKPKDGEDWVKTGPHVMVFGTAATAGYPRDAKPDTSKPYVMFPDTPYEHLMIPVS